MGGKSTERILVETPVLSRLFLIAGSIPPGISGGAGPCCLSILPNLSFGTFLPGEEKLDRVAPMRVLVTINCRWWNASAAIAVGQARALAALGHRVLLQVGPGDPAGPRAEQHGVPVRYIGLRAKPIPLAGVFLFRRLVSAFGPDVVCCHRGPGHAASVLAVAGRVPIVRVRSDIRPARKGVFSSLVDRRTSLTVVPSKWMGRKAGRFRSGPGPVEVVDHFVDTDRFGFVPERTGSPVIVALGRLSPIKGYRTLIRACSALDGAARVVIAGAEAQYTREDLTARAREFGVEDLVDVEPPLDDVVPLLESATLGAVPSLGSEVVSRACLEMMSTGLPVLAAATNGLLDQVRDGVTGLIHPPGDWRTLARHAAWLLEQPAVRSKMGRAARSVCEEQYSMEVVGRKWEECLSGLVSRRNKKYPSRVPGIGRSRPGARGPD